MMTPLLPPDVLADALQDRLGPTSGRRLSATALRRPRFVITAGRPLTIAELIAKYAIPPTVVQRVRAVMRATK